MIRTQLPVLAALGVAGATGLLAALRIRATGTAAAAGTPQEMLPVLVAIGLLCLVGLTIRRRPTIAGLATIGASVIVTIDLAAFGRTVRPDLDAGAWTWLVVAISLSAIFGVLAAAAYATDPRRATIRWAAPLATLAVGAVAIAGVWAVANAGVPVDAASDSPLGAVVAVTRTFLATTAILTAAGVVADVRPAVRRARRRVAAARPDPSGAGERIAWLNAIGRATIDELAPGRSRARQAAVAERSRIAREMHAEVVPALRRSLASAEAGASPEGLAASLRETLDQVEGVIDAEHSIHLEIGGLVPAIEAAAESIEARSDVTVTIDVMDGGPDGAGPAPMDVAIAAVRVARLALDNVARHAPGSSVLVALTESRTRVSMTIDDDGPGTSAAARADALERGRRGLVDMMSEADACGATVEVIGRAPGQGTRVSFDWSGNSAPP